MSEIERDPEQMVEDPEADQEARDFAGLFSTEQGQRVLNVIRLTFDKDDIFTPDPQVTAFNCGAREAFRWIEFMAEKGRA